MPNLTNTGVGGGDGWPTNNNWDSDLKMTKQSINNRNLYIDMSRSSYIHPH